MMHATSESDMASIGPPSSASPRAYYVQSPSGDSQDDIDKCSSSSNGPCTSPSYPRHSLTSSSSTTISRIFGNRRRWNKHYCDVVAEEGGDEDFYGRRAYEKHCNAVVLSLAFGMVFVGVCLVVWGVSKHYKAEVSIKRLSVDNVYYGEGLDHTGVPTKLMTVNCSASLEIKNPATFFGIQLTSHTANLIFSHITVASGQLKKYYQPGKSRRSVWVRLVGKEVQLYGAGTRLATNGGSGGIPFRLEFGINSYKHVVGELIKTKHTISISCFLLIHPHHSKQILFHNNSCKYL